MSSCIDDTNTIDLDITGGVLTADLIISPDDENAAEARANGLYVDAAGVPVASIIATARNAAPSGWLMCDGGAVSRSTYDDLFDEIGETYGVGDGTTTFNLPDLRGRVVVMKGTHADVNALAENEGMADVAHRRPKHDHEAVVSQTPHDHGGVTGSKGFANQGIVAGTDANVLLDASTEEQGSHTHTIPGDDANVTVAVGPNDGTEPDDAPAYLVLNYLIKI